LVPAEFAEQTPSARRSFSLTSALRLQALREFCFLARKEELSQSGDNNRSASLTDEPVSGKCYDARVEFDLKRERRRSGFVMKQTKKNIAVKQAAATGVQARARVNRFLLSEAGSQFCAGEPELDALNEMLEGPHSSDHPWLRRWPGGRSRRAIANTRDHQPYRPQANPSSGWPIEKTPSCGD